MTRVVMTRRMLRPVLTRAVAGRVITGLMLGGMRARTVIGGVLRRRMRGAIVTRGMICVVRCSLVSDSVMTCVVLWLGTGGLRNRNRDRRQGEDTDRDDEPFHVQIISRTRRIAKPNCGNSGSGPAKDHARCRQATVRRSPVSRELHPGTSESHWR